MQNDALTRDDLVKRDGFLLEIPEESCRLTGAPSFSVTRLLWSASTPDTV
jgi:hypothetical protein